MYISKNQDFIFTKNIEFSFRSDLYIHTTNLISVAKERVPNWQRFNKLHMQNWMPIGVIWYSKITGAYFNNSLFLASNKKTCL